MNTQRKYIDWQKTGKNLQRLRNDNLHLRRNVCNALNYGKGACSGKCEVCIYEMDSSISRVELAKIFNVTESIVFNWENGITPVPLEDVLFYAQIAGVEVAEIIVYR